MNAATVAYVRFTDSDGANTWVGPFPTFGAACNWAPKGGERPQNATILGPTSPETCASWIGDTRKRAP